MGNLLKGFGKRGKKSALDILDAEEARLGALAEGKRKALSLPSKEDFEKQSASWGQWFTEWRKAIMAILERVFDDGDEVREMLRAQNAEQEAAGALKRAVLAFMEEQFQMSSDRSFPLSEMILKLEEALGEDGQLSNEVQQLLWDMGYQLKEKGQAIALTASDQFVLYDEDLHRRAPGGSYWDGMEILPAEGLCLEDLPKELPRLLRKQNPHRSRTDIHRWMEALFDEAAEEPSVLHEMADQAALLISVMPGAGGIELWQQTLGREVTHQRAVGAIAAALVLLAAWNYCLVKSPLKFLKVHQQIQSGEKKPEDFAPHRKTK